MSGDQKTTAWKIRNFFRELLRSEYCRFLEQELVRQRMDADARIRALIAEKLELVQKIDRLEIVIAPQLRRPFTSALESRATLQSTAELAAPLSWKQALEAHERQMDEEEKENATVSK